MPTQAVAFEIREFKSGRVVETITGEDAARDRCIALHLRDGRNSYYYIAS